MKAIIRDHNGILSELKPHFELVNTVQEAEVVVLWQDIIAMGLCIAKLAKQLHKPLVVIQHGAHGMEDYVPPLSNKLLADKVLVWGQYDKDQLMDNGISPKRIAITGTTVFRHLKGRTPHKGTHILFSPEHWDHDIEENLTLYNKLKEICKKNEWELKVKVMERHDKDRYKEHMVYSDREQPEHLDICADVLSWADVLVSVSEITFELMAQASDIPVICCDISKPRMFLNNPRYLELKKPYSKGVKVIYTLDSLEQTIEGQLKNPEELQKERADVVLMRGGVHIKDPLSKIIEEIKNVK